ncbi:DUF2835 domain-containing protein [Shewanella maritima]|uniref:DUF2835 domain-containing protein n=1 Tax=Shewanella maritima TaxID=2520507 RepID=UPI0037356271
MQYYFRCNISYDDFLLYYQGHVNKVEVIEQFGRVLHVNAKYFLPFLQPEGIKGQFCLDVDEKGGFQSLKKI